MMPDTRDAIGRAVLETLEHRQLFSSVVLDQGVLTLTGNPQARNDISVELSNDGQQLRGIVNGQASQWVRASTLRTISIIGGDLADSIRMNPAITVAARVDARGGNDTIVTGAGNDIINAGAGDDSVHANAGRDRVHGEGGNDTLVGGAGNDTLVGGGGDDSLIGGGGHDRLFTNAGRDYASGGKGNDILHGTAQDRLVRGPGNGRILLGADPGLVLGFDLINAVDGKKIATLKDGDKINLRAMPSTRFNVVARVSSGFDGSVRWSLNNQSNVRIENAAPFRFAADGKSATGWQPTAGKYALAATSFAEDNARGEQGSTYRLNFEFTNTPLPSTGGGTTTPGGGTTAPGGNTNTGNTGNTGGTTPNAAQRPVPVIEAVARTLTAGQAVHVNAVKTVLKNGTITDATYEWNFGDSSGKYNTLRGFNAAHVYEKPGKYVVTLKVTDSKGNSSTATTHVTVTASGRKVLYVSGSGSDSNSGLTQNSPLKTAQRAFELLGPDTEVRFKRGDAFTLTAGHVISKSNILVGAYGIGERPLITWTGARDRGVMLTITRAASNVSVQDITFDSRFRSDTGQQGMPYAIQAGGTNVNILRNEFLNLGYAINLNNEPRGAIIQDNVAPLRTGIRDYFTWVAGQDVTIVGNSVANATREHVIRMSGIDRVLVAHNDLTNLDRRDEGDRYDTAKGAIVVQKGQYAYVYSNKANGPTGVGPLGDADGLPTKESRFKFAVFEQNDFTGTFTVHHGAEHVRVDRNVLRGDDANQIEVEGYSGSYGRGVVNVVFDENVGVNNGTRGNFIRVLGPVSGRFELTGNTLIAPNLQTGAYGTAAVYVHRSSLDDFTRIANNTWPTPDNALVFAQGGMNFVGTSMTSSGYLTASEWNAFGIVESDNFRNVRLTDVIRALGITGPMLAGRFAG
jgi:hypothetical protein